MTTLSPLAHRRLSLWQSPVPSVTTKLAPRQVSVFSDTMGWWSTASDTQTDGFPLPQWASCQIRKLWLLRMRRECRELFPRHRLQRKPLVSDPGMHHSTCVTHVPWCMSLTRGGGENVPGIPGACATHNFTYMARGPSWRSGVIFRMWRAAGDVSCAKSDVSTHAWPVIGSMVVMPSHRSTIKCSKGNWTTSGAGRSLTG